jgi:uncharacterized membrane-anchored protein
LGLLMALCCAVAAKGAGRDDSPLSKLNWLKGPVIATLGNVAQIQVPEGYNFLDGKGTRAMFKAFGEPTSGQELGLITPTNREARWSVVFEFSDIGYVKDDDKDKLDADKLLKSIKQGNDYANEERKKSGVPPLNIVGWEVPPKYNEESHNLEWAIRAESEGRPILNYNTRILGRKGVMEVVLIVPPDNLSTILPKFRDLMKDYDYKSGQAYTEYKSGDKIAKYGLAALITGGAVAVAAKTGLLAGLVLFLKKGWKLLVFAVVAVIAFFKRIIFGRSARSDTSADAQ